MKNHPRKIESGTSSMAHGAVSVGVAAAQIAAANENRRSVLVQNLSANDLYVGGVGVTTATGVKVPPGEAITIYVQAAVYGIASGAGSDIRYLEEHHG